MPPLPFGGQEPASRMIGAFLVLLNNRTAPNIHVSFEWQVLSELCQLATKHGLGSLAIANILQFLAADEITPFDIKQLAQLLSMLIQYMML